MATRCKHCKRSQAYARRGLCGRCYRNPEIRARYPRAQRCGYKGLGLGEQERPLPPPTKAYPGTRAKVAVLIARAEQGLALWSPLDRPLRRDDNRGRGEQR
jgi:hypothetical protein